jgi:tetratricopeptide (TPR) repeat protein
MGTGRKDLLRARLDEAKAAFEELLKQYPGEADLHLFLGMTFLRLRDPQAAVLGDQESHRYRSEPCRSANAAWLRRAEIRGDVNAAIREYQNVIELKPDRAEAYSNLAVAQKKKGDLEQAILSLNKALELKPGFASALTTRGGIFADQ